MVRTRRQEYGRMRYVYTGWAVLETMLFGGIVNGWASLVFVLKEDGLYGDLCTPLPPSPLVSDNSTTPSLLQADGQVTCREQDAMLNLWFTIAAALRNIFGIVVGLHVFKFGTRSARLTGWVVFVLGSLMMAFANQSIPWLVLPSLMTLSYGGVTLLLTNVQVSCLFPHAAGVVITLVSGAFDFSASTQLIVKVLHESGLLSRMYSYVGLAGLHAGMVLLSTLCFMPKDMFVRLSDHSQPQDPPPKPALRKRRDSLYDWSEIKVRSGRHTLKCGVCDDDSSDGDLKEQLTMKSVLALQAALKKDAVDEDELAPQRQGVNGDAKVRNSSNARAAFCLGEYSRPAGGPWDRSEFPSAKRIITRNSHLPYSSTRHLHAPVEANMKPFFHSQGGLNGLRSSAPIASISGTLKERQQGNIKAITIRGRFISVIDVTPIAVKTPRPQAFSQLNGNLTAEPDFRMWKPETNPSWKTKKYPSWKPESDQSWKPEIHQSQSQKPETDQSWKSGTVQSWTLEENERDVLGPLGRQGRLSSNLRAKDKVPSHHRVHLDVEEKAKTETPARSEAGTDELFPTLKSCLTCTVFWLHVLWQSFNVLRLVAFFGLINPKLTATFNGDKDKVSFFTNIQAYFMLSIMGVSWISGAIYDWQTNVLSGRSCEFQRRVLPGALPLAITSLLGVAISVMWIIENEVVLYVMFAFLVFYNAFTFGVCISFLLRVFPERYFGLLNGLLSIIAGSFCFLQYGIFHWIEAYPQGTLHAEIFMLTLVVLSLIHPVYITVKGTCLAR